MRTTVSSVNASGTRGMVRCALVERVFGRGQRPAVERDRFELELVAVEHERRRRSFAAGLRSTASLARTRAWSSRMSTSRSTVAIRNAGGA